jgi:plastocyanin
VTSAPAVFAAPGDHVAQASDQGVSIDSFAFAPADVTVPVGATLTWSNAQSGIPHTSTSVDGLWDSGVLSTGDTFNFTFNQVGDFSYQCNIHPSMHGIVHVSGGASTDGSAIATTDSTTSTGVQAPAAAATDLTVAAPTPTATSAQSPTPTVFAPTPMPSPSPARYYSY